MEFPEIISLDKPAGRLLVVVAPVLYIAAICVGCTIIGWPQAGAAALFCGGIFGPFVLLFLANWIWGLITWIKDGEPHWFLADDWGW